MSEPLNFFEQLAIDTGITESEAKASWGKLINNISAAKKVAAFHTKFGLGYDGPPRELDDDLALFRIGFMLEELAEYCVASGYKKLGEDLHNLHSMLQNREVPHTARVEQRNFHDQLDALVDLSYVLHGTAYLQGFDIDGAFQVVHTANMAKVRVERAEDSKRGSTYDVVKPEGWTPPDLTEFLK